MASIFTHPVVPVALSISLPRAVVSRAVILAGATCSVIPDFDVIGFSFGIDYGDPLGHRGITHSVAFAVALAGLLSLTVFRGTRSGRWWIFGFLFLATVSHGLLDMLTNGGLGVALWAPFSNERYFFPWRPLEVSPIGAANFISRSGARALASELIWVWLPSAVVYLLGRIARRSTKGHAI